MKNITSYGIIQWNSEFTGVIAQSYDSTCRREPMKEHHNHESLVFFFYFNVLTAGYKHMTAESAAVLYSTINLIFYTKEFF